MSELRAPEELFPRFRRVRASQRGVLFITSIVIALIMMLWVVAALLRARQQTATILQSHHKIQANALAKTAMSYALFYINVDAGWLQNIKGADPDTPGGPSPWKGIEGASVWASQSSDGKLTLISKGVVNGQASKITVPLLELEEKDTTALTVMKSTDGHYMISSNQISASGWEALPPIPHLPKILSATGTDSGDIYAVTDKPEGVNLLWRYRPGRGWIELVDPPEDGMEDLAIWNSKRLVTFNDDSLMVMPLDSSMEWRRVKAPAGQLIDRVATAISGSSSVYALTKDTAGKSSLFKYDLPDDPKQELKASDWRSGSALPAGVDSVDGGLGVSSDGKLYIAVNSSDSPSRVFRQSAGGEWQELPPVPFFQWSGGVNQTLSLDPPPVQKIDGLKVDDGNNLWVNAKDPHSQAYINIRVSDAGVSK